MEVVKQESEISRVKKILVLLIAVAVFLFLLALFLSIHTDGLGVGIGVVIPFSALLLIVLIFTFVIGFRNRKSLKKWYLFGLFILCCGLYLWSPLMKPTRMFIERNLRWGSRNKVVEDIRSGLLQSVEGRVAVPYKKYGRVSFLDIYIYRIQKQTM